MKKNKNNFSIHLFIWNIFTLSQVCTEYVHVYLLVYSNCVWKQQFICTPADSTLQVKWFCFWRLLPGSRSQKVFKWSFHEVWVWRRLAGWPPGRSGGSQAWWWGRRWPPQRGRHTPAQRHASCGTGRLSPSGNSSLHVDREGWCVTTELNYWTNHWAICVSFSHRSVGWWPRPWQRRRYHRSSRTCRASLDVPLASPGPGTQSNRKTQ